MMKLTENSGPGELGTKAAIENIAGGVYPQFMSGVMTQLHQLREKAGLHFSCYRTTKIFNHTGKLDQL